MEREYTKALIYCRVSSERQVKEGNGLESQEHRCRQYAESLNLQVERVFRDEGISGGLFDRPAMKSLLSYLDTNWQTPYFVIFDDLKRFARDVEVHLRLKSEFQTREAKLRCLNYNFDDSAEGEFVETIFAAQNELERKQNRRQVLQKMRARIERGYWCFCPPTGLEYKKNREHGKILTPIQPITDVLRDALIQFSDDRLLTQTDVVHYLKARNLHGLMGKRERCITHEFVKGVLTQPLYAGLIFYRKWGISRLKGRHEAIITESVYDAIQAKLERPERKPRETDVPEFVLRRVISCSECRLKMTGSISKGKRKYYAHYTCNNKHCTANPKNILSDKLEQDYLGLLEKVTVEPEYLEVGRKIVERVWNDKIKEFSAFQAATEAEKKEVERMIDDYIDLIPTARSASIKERYEAKIEELDQRIKQLERDAKAENTPDISHALDLTFKFLGTPALAWEKADKQMKIMLHNMIFIENPTYSLNTGFGTPKLSLPFQLIKDVGSKNIDLVDLARIELASERSAGTVDERIVSAFVLGAATRRILRRCNQAKDALGLALGGLARYDVRLSERRSEREGVSEASYCGSDL